MSGSRMVILAAHNLARAARAVLQRQACGRRKGRGPVRNLTRPGSALAGLTSERVTFSKSLIGGVA